MATKHKAKGNQSTEQAQAFNLEVALIESAKQLGDYAHAKGKEDQAVKDKQAAKAALDKIIPKLHKLGVKLGELPRTGAEDGYKNNKLTPAQVLTVGIYNAMPADLTHAVKKNYLSCFRNCVAESRAFTTNLSRDKAVKGDKAGTSKAGSSTKTGAAKPSDTKPSEAKQSLADVIKQNFKTLLANNPQAAADLVDELADMLD